MTLIEIDMSAYEDLGYSKKEVLIVANGGAPTTDDYRKFFRNGDGIIGDGEKVHGTLLGTDGEKSLKFDLPFAGKLSLLHGSSAGPPSRVSALCYEEVFGQTMGALKSVFGRFEDYLSGVRGLEVDFSFFLVPKEEIGQFRSSGYSSSSESPESFMDVSWARKIDGRGSRGVSLVVDEESEAGRIGSSLRRLEDTAA